MHITESVGKKNAIDLSTRQRGCDTRTTCEKVHHRHATYNPVVLLKTNKLEVLGDNLERTSGVTKPRRALLSSSGSVKDREEPPWQGGTLQTSKWEEGHMQRRKQFQGHTEEQAKQQGRKERQKFQGQRTWWGKREEVGEQAGSVRRCHGGTGAGFGGGFKPQVERMFKPRRECVRPLVLRYRI